MPPWPRDKVIGSIIVLPSSHHRPFRSLYLSIVDGRRPSFIIVNGLHRHRSSSSPVSTDGLHRRRSSSVFHRRCRSSPSSPVLTVVAVRHPSPSSPNLSSPVLIAVPKSQARRSEGASFNRPFSRLLRISISAMIRFGTQLNQAVVI